MTDEPRYPRSRPSNFDPEFEEDDDYEDLDEEDLALGDRHKKPAASEQKLDFNALLHAWQDQHPDNRYYLDTTSGSIKLVNKNLLDLGELTDEIERHKYRYLYLPKAERNQQRNDLKDFKNSLEAPDLVKLLEVGLESPHPLSAFQTILSTNQELSEQLKEFLTGRARLRIRQWLEANFLNERFPI
jgi:hypothetical protein